MGVKNLWDILESCKKTLPLHHLQNKRVCVDLSCWMVQLHSVNKSHCALKEKIYLKGLFHRIRALIALNCSLIFVADGSIPAIKLSTYRRRLNAGNETVLDDGNPHKVSSLKRNKGSEFSCMIKEAKVIAMALGIPCLDGIEEAEAQCALLNSESLCDGCFTSDSDAFLFGARTVYRDICLGDGGFVVCYEMDDIERQLGFGRNSLITLAVLLGSDYTHGVRGFGPESACQIVRSIGDATVLQRFSSEGFSIARKHKAPKKKSQASTFEKKENGGERHLSVGDEFLQVIDAYMNPKCHSADSDVVHRVLAVYPFDRSQLHQACARFFDWPPQKTDEYILPKIAERNLRRFANLRSVSSKLGVQISITEMPVKCPISCIVKTRKIQGRDLFEVSWADMDDGLETSAVPADLVESACPEKILEFNQRKAQKQKPNRKPRPKKAERTEIDERLDKLMLDIEKESSARATSASSAKVLRDSSATNRVSDLTIGSKAKGSEIEGNNRTTSNSTEVDIIDLVSPAPQIQNRSFLNGQDDVRSCSIIDLSDTDSEASSPEHARKVKELRLFMTKLRDEGFS